MAMGNYQRGVRAEKKTAEWLRGKGYYAVEVRGSHGAVDIMATSTHAIGVVAVQVKSGRKLSRVEFAAARFALRGVPMPENGRRWLVSWARYAREPEVEVVE